jgi:outer membrane protein
MSETRLSRSKRPSAEAGGWKRAAIVVAFLLCGAENAFAITLMEAIESAYVSNAQLGAQRSFVRATDEKVPQALSGYRPRISVTATGGYQYQTTDTLFGTFRSTQAASTVPYAVGATASQTLFNGFQTANRVRASEAEVSAANEGLRVLDQSIILAAATAHMDCLRDQATVTIQQSNLRALEDFLSQTMERYKLGEVTRTDIAQARTQLAAARTQLALAQAALTTSLANFVRITGAEPIKLAPGSPVDWLHPPSLEAGLLEASRMNPRIAAAAYGVDIAFLQIKINEGSLFPSLALVVSAQQQYNSTTSTASQFTTSASGQLSVPIFQGGAEYSFIRQSKESLAQQKQALEQVRAEVRGEFIQQWAFAKAARIQLASATAQVAAAEMALDGVREEARLGQRTTLDVLNAQQALVLARLSLINAQRDRVVSSFGVTAATGKLSPKLLRLKIPAYEPRVHYHQVRDTWVGLRTPDGQ